MKIKIFITIALFGLLGASCSKDFLDVSPSTSAGEENLINSISDLRIATNGVYDILSNADYYSDYYANYYEGEFTFFPDLMGDLMMEAPWSSGHLRYNYAYGFTKVNVKTALYRLVYLGLQDVNKVIEKSNKLDDTPEKAKLIAELRVLRALLHFDLVRLYGPLYSNLGKGAIKADALGIRIAKEPYTDVRQIFYRDKTSDVYNFIAQELKEAVPQLPKEKRNGYIDYWGGRALQAKVALYMEDNDLALIAAEEVIKKSGLRLYTRDEYVASWGKEYGSESIFELATTPNDNADWFSIGFICNENGDKTMVPTKDFIDLMNADPNDIRFNLLVHSDDDDCYYISGKYPGRDGNIKVNNPKVLRLSEVYLIAAEAAFKLGNGKAGFYLTELRKNRTTTDPSKYETSVTLDDILYERAVELYGEGDRCWDMWRNQRPIVRWSTPEEKVEKMHTDNLEIGEIPFDYYQTIQPISERELELLPVEDRDAQQNPGY